MTQLTEAAKSALISANCNRQGARISVRTALHVVRALQAIGLIGPGGGLTVRGTIARERLVEEEMNF